MKEIKIQGMTDQEKSELLAKAVGYTAWITLPPGKWTERVQFINLYEVDDNGDPLFMALAWRVLNWGIEYPWNNVPGYTITGNVVILRLFENARMIKMLPADAMRLWLDKILELCIEAGLIELGPKWISDNPDLEARKEFEDNLLL